MFSRGASGWVHVEGASITKETAKAFFVEVEEWGQGKWIPKSVISHPEVYNEGDKDVTISLQEWFALKEDLC